jgi:hypothetical protein
MSSGQRRAIGLGGLLFVVIVVAAIASAGNSPAANASLGTILSYYHHHRGTQLVSAYLLEIAVIVGLVFFWYLRQLLIECKADRLLVNLGFVGVILFASAGALSGGFRYALWDYLGSSVISTSTVQTLNSLQQDANVILSGVGQAVFLLATGIALVRSGALGRWLGWIAVVLGVIGVVIPFFGPVPAGLWVIVACIVLLAGAKNETSGHGALSNPATAG